MYSEFEQNLSKESAEGGGKTERRGGGGGIDKV